MSTRTLYGLVLAGGFSRRMGQDKALLKLHKEPQALWTARLLDQVCENVYISCRKGQDLAGADIEFTPVYDTQEGGGPIHGMVTASAANPNADWLVTACDLPRLTRETLESLVENRSDAPVTAFRSASDTLPEPLCAIYSPVFMDVLKEAAAQGRRCPRKLLIQHEDQVTLLELPQADALDNFNTPEHLNTGAL